MGTISCGLTLSLEGIIPLEILLTSFLCVLKFPDAILKFYGKSLNFTLIGEIKEVVYLVYRN